jgi:hypothetical protein
MEAICSSETLFDTQRTTRRYIPPLWEHQTLQPSQYSTVYTRYRRRPKGSHKELHLMKDTNWNLFLMQLRSAPIPVPISWSIQSHFWHHCRAYTATIKDGYWIDNWIYWITISYTTRLQCITLYNSQQLSSLPLKTPAPTLQPPLQPTLMASLAITH